MQSLNVGRILASATSAAFPDNVVWEDLVELELGMWFSDWNQQCKPGQASQTNLHIMEVIVPSALGPVDTYPLVTFQVSEIFNVPHEQLMCLLTGCFDHSNCNSA